MIYTATINQRPMDALFDLRGERPAIADVAAVVGLSLPERRNSMTSSDEASVFWIGPERWMLRAPLAREDVLADAFATAVGDRFASTLPVSDMYVGVEVSGLDARDVLARGCPINLHPARFAVDAATSTEMFGTSVILCHEDDHPSFTAYVDRSYVDFVMGRLRRSS